MQNPTLQMGVEVEMHGLSFSFRRTEVGHTDDFWPQPPMGTDVEATMMAHDPILVPESFANNALAQSTDTLAWVGNWGFMVCGDAFGLGNDTVQGTGLAIAYGRCTALEMNTAAHEIRDADYWLLSRAAIKLFREALLDFVFPAVPTPLNGTLIFNNHERWYPIDELVNAYNAKINALWATNGWGLGAPNIQDWRLKKSYHLEQFEVGGNYKGVPSTWEAHFAVRRTVNSAGQNVYEINCDAQVNYQIDLEYLYEHTDEWLSMWSHIWMHGMATGAGTFASPDPVSGHHSGGAMNIVYRNQINAALWRLGRELSDDLMGRLASIVTLNLAPLPPQVVTQLKALMMMMLAMGTIEPGAAAHGGTPKNSYSQFPKTSPASIVEHMGNLAQRTWVRRLGGDSAFPEVGNLTVAAFAHGQVSNFRAGNRQNLAPYLPAGRAHNLPVPVGVLDLYSGATSLADAILTNALPLLQFTRMWKGAFSTGAQNAGNKFGYDVNAPFYCYWAFAHTAKAADRDPATGRIKILFESRYGHNRLNMGFHPGSSEETFYEAYKSLFLLTVPSKTERAATLDTVKDSSSSWSRRKHRNKLDKGQKRGVH